MRTKKQFFFIWFQYYSSIKPHKQHYYINRKNMEEFIYPTSCNRPFLFVKNWRTVFGVQISSWLISPTSFLAKLDGCRGLPGHLFIPQHLQSIRVVQSRSEVTTLPWPHWGRDHHHRLNNCEGGGARTEVTEMTLEMVTLGDLAQGWISLPDVWWFSYRTLWNI